MVGLYGDAFSAAELIAWLKMENKTLKFPKLTNISGNSIFFENDIYNINLVRPLYKRYKKLKDYVPTLIVNLYYLNDPKKIIFFVGFDYYDQDILDNMNLSSIKFNSDKYTQVDRSSCKIRKVVEYEIIEFNMGSITSSFENFSDKSEAVSLEEQIQYLNSESFLREALNEQQFELDLSDKVQAKYYRNTQKAFKEKKFWIRIWPYITDINKMRKTDLDWRERYNIVKPYMNEENHVVDFSSISQENIDKIYDKNDDKSILVYNQDLIYKD
jgi:hypothetical protein